MPKIRDADNPPTVTAEGATLHADLAAWWARLDAVDGTDRYPFRFVHHNETRQLLAAWMAGDYELHRVDTSFRKKAA